MSSSYLVAAWELPDLTPAQKLVMLTLADSTCDYDDYVGLCPAFAPERLQLRTSMGASELDGVLHQLEVKGLLRRFTNDEGSWYWLLFAPSGGWA